MPYKRLKASYRRLRNLIPPLQTLSLAVLYSDCLRGLTIPSYSGLPEERGWRRRSQHFNRLVFTMSSASPKRSTKDLSRAVAFLALERVQQSSDDTRMAFLIGKGFTKDEIVEATRQAENVRRSTSSTSNDGHQTFGGATALAVPLTTIGHVTEPGAKFSTRVMLGGGSISFVSLASGPDDGIITPQAQLNTLLARFNTLLASAPSPRDKADVAVIYLSVKGLARCEEEVHKALDCWVDAHAPPMRFLVEQTGKRNMVNLMAVVRG